MPKKIIGKIAKIIALILGVFAFAVLAAAISYYAAGWRLDFSNLKPYRIGVITLQTNPPDATVYVNNTKVYQKTPTDIRDIKPGEYEIKIEKENYLTWQKKVKVSSGMVTRLENILLFLKDTKPEVAIEEKVDFAFANPNRSALAFVTSEEENAGVWLYDYSSRQQAKLFPLLAKHLENKYEIQKIFWSQNSDAILVVSRVADAIFGHLISVQNPKDLLEFSLPDIPQQSLLDFAKKQAYLIIQDKLFLFTASESNLILNNVSQIFSQDQKIFALQSQEKGTIISSYEINEQKASLVLESPRKLKFLSQKTPFLADEKDNLFYLKENKLIPLEIDAKYILDNQDTLASDGFLLYLISLEDKPQTKLLATLSDEFTPLWEIDKNHFLLQDKEGIFAIYFDGTNKNYLLKGEAQFLGLKDKEMLYFDGQIKSVKIR